MTTIACDGKSMAADGLVINSDIISKTDERKIYRIKGSIFGFAGHQHLRDAFLQWKKGNAEKPKFADNRNFQAIELREDGTVYEWESQLFPALTPPPVTLGTGWMIALGAMLAGKTAEEAVKLTCIVDVYSGGKVTVEYLDAERQ